MIVRNPKWHNREHTMIVCEIDWQGDWELDHVQGMHAFVAYENDHYEHGRDLFTRLRAGEFGRIAEYEVPS